MGNRATIYESLEWQEAQALEAQVIEVKKRVLGKEHLDTLDHG
jgi:hypothetical protein